MNGGALPIILAHGALGEYDEIIFLGVGVVFVVLMGLSWLRSRNQTPEDAIQPETHPKDDDSGNERFTLE